MIGGILRPSYTFDPGLVHAVIIVRNLYSPIESLVHGILEEGVPCNHVLLLNSGSTSSLCIQKLKELERLGCQVLDVAPESYCYGPYVIWMDSKLGLPLSFWNYPFILTDPDLDIRGLPPGWLRTLFQVLNHQRWASKIALGLRTDDLTISSSKTVKEWERNLSQRFPYALMNRLLGRLVPSRACPTDTTFALYRPQRHFTTMAVRLEGAFRVRHLPWYSAFVKTKEYSYYRQSKDPGIGMWS